MADHQERVAAYVRGLLRRDGLVADDLPIADGLVMETAGGPGPHARLALQPRDRDTVRKVERGEAITQQEAIRLESIIVPNGLRPSFDIAHDSFADLPDPWTRLNDRRADLVPIIKATGRVDLAGHPARVFAGTAFLVAPDLLLTNRHVANLFVDGVGDAPALRFTPGVSAAVDLKQEVATADTVRLTVVAPVLVLDRWDAALLRVTGLPAGVGHLPLAGSPPPGINGRLAAVIGYPAPEDDVDTLQQINIFRGVFFKKRMMPGRLSGRRPAQSFGRTVDALAHDCTTLGGNSGSSVIDVESGLIVGLHFAGERLAANFAVPTWELAADPRVAGAGVTFV